MPDCESRRRLQPHRIQPPQACCARCGDRNRRHLNGESLLGYAARAIETASRRGGRAVEGACLESKCTVHPVPWVRIPPSPPIDFPADSARSAAPRLRICSPACLQYAPQTDTVPQCALQPAHTPHGYGGEMPLALDVKSLLDLERGGHAQHAKRARARHCGAPVARSERAGSLQRPRLGPASGPQRSRGARTVDRSRCE
jgi:hypothetical protein